MGAVPTLRTPEGIACWITGSGPVVLTVHGGPGTDHTFFRPYLDLLADERQVVYFDLPGHGASNAPSDYGLEPMAGAIESVRRALGVERVTLLGSSYGGFLSIEYALGHPDHIESLVLVDTSASHGFREESLVTARERGTDAMLAALERLWDGTLTTDDEFHRAWREILPLYFHHLPADEIRRLADRATYRLETRKQILPSLQGYDVRDRLGEIEAPTLVIAGRHDWITSVRQADELHAGLPRSELLVFEESGHYPFIEETDGFLRLVRAFLNGTASQVT